MKIVRQCLYVHRSAVHTLPDEWHSLVAHMMQKIPGEYVDFAIVKVGTKTEAVSFIKSPDWDSANEPSVGDGVVVYPNGEILFTNAKGQIYHHKWAFVDPDYQGFNVEESKKRSEMWQSILPRTREVKSRIGYRKYWDALLEQYNIPR